MLRVAVRRSVMRWVGATFEAEDVSRTMRDGGGRDVHKSAYRITLFEMVFA